MLKRLRKETEYFTKKSQILRGELEELERTVEYNSTILEGTLRDLQESSIMIDTMRRMLK